MDFAIVVVSFNTKDKLRQALSMVFASKTKYTFDLWVVDNASTDGSVEMVRAEFPQVRLIVNSENHGFAQANNQAIRQMDADFVLLLNSDADVEANTFDKLLDYMKAHPMVGMCTPKLIKPDGTLDKACKRSFPDPRVAFFRLSGLALLFPKSRIVAKYNLTYTSDDEIQEVDSIVGAFMLVRREVINQIGLLDESFFMYGEDIDWCYRAKAAGWKIMYVPITTVLHHKGASSRKLPERMIYEFHRAMIIFYDKHYRQKYNFLVNFLVRIGIWARYYFKLWENSLRREKYVSK